MTKSAVRTVLRVVVVVIVVTPIGLVVLGAMVVATWLGWGR